MNEFCDNSMRQDEYLAIINHFFNAIKMSQLYAEYNDFDFIECLEKKYGGDSSDSCGYSIATGATKVVLIPNRESKYVIKIPFFGENEDEEFCYANDLNLSFEKLFADIYPIPLAASHWDYCQIEVMNYNLIKKYRANLFFAETFLFTEFKDHPVYLQEKVKSELIFPTKSSGKKWSSSKHQHQYKDSSLFPSFLDFYSEEEVDCLEKLLEEYPIKDLTPWNFGSTLDGKPIIFDYAGYYEDSVYNYYNSY